ncbi:hypothetical protein ACC785_38775, partial [Rhizobium ruizarguesonis]
MRWPRGAPSRGCWRYDRELEHLTGRTVIVGSGIAGLMTSLTLAPEPSIIVTRAASEMLEYLGHIASILSTAR